MWGASEVMWGRGGLPGGLLGALLLFLLAQPSDQAVSYPPTLNCRVPPQ